MVPRCVPKQPRYYLHGDGPPKIFEAESCTLQRETFSTRDFRFYNREQCGGVCEGK